MTGRVLVTGWFSFRHGEATAGDVLAAAAVSETLQAAGVAHETAWSPVFRPGALTLADAQPERYSALVFACGPVSGWQVAGLHKRYARCRRIAVGVSVVDPGDPAAAGFDLILARDGGGAAPELDLAVAAPPAVLRLSPAPAGPVPVTGVVLASGQGEYGERRRHERVTGSLGRWLAVRDCAPVMLETRLDSRDWRLCSTAEAVSALVARMDVVVTTRLHGLVLALLAGVPALAVDPVAGGGKVAAQAAAWRWPAVLSAEQAADPRLLDARWNWCLSADGRDAAAAAAASARARPGPLPLLAALSSVLSRDPNGPGWCGRLPARGAGSRGSRPDRSAAMTEQSDPGAMQGPETMIEITGDQDRPQIAGWGDSGSIAVITWRAGTGGTHQQEVAQEQEAIRLLRSIEADEHLSLISAQLRRAGISPQGS